MTQLTEFTHPIRPDSDSPGLGTRTTGDPTQGGDRPRMARANVPAKTPVEGSPAAESARSHGSERQPDDAAPHEDAPTAESPVWSRNGTGSRQVAFRLNDYVSRHPIHGVLAGVAAGVVLAHVVKK